jgi:hypothetical protein
VSAATVAEPTLKGIDPSILDSFNVISGVAGWRVPYFDSEGTHYRTKLFPFDGEELDGGARSRWIGKSKPQIPYGAWQLRKADRRALILTEGESDTWALAEFVPSVVALGIPGASAWKPGWLAGIDDFERIYLSFDADDAGRKLADIVMRDISRARYVTLPDGADTRSFLQRCGREDYLRLVREAEAVYRIRRSMNVAAEAVRRGNLIRDGWLW